jgi:hypothetical protein
MMLVTAQRFSKNIEKLCEERNLSGAVLFYF